MTVTGAPDVTAVIEYLTAGSGDSSWAASDVQQALDAEQSDQAARLRFPLNAEGNPTYPPALVEALCRRVAHYLAVRALPLGVQATITDSAALNTYVGSTDAEVRRLEAPWRRRTVG